MAIQLKKQIKKEPGKGPINCAANNTSSKRARMQGLTGVELPIVITVLGILISMLLPAVQAAREANNHADAAFVVDELFELSMQYKHRHAQFPESWMQLADFCDQREQCTVVSTGYGVNITIQDVVEPKYRS